MRRIIVVVALVVLVVSATSFAAELGIFAGKEMNGRQRYLAGFDFRTTSGLWGIDIQAFAPLGAELDFSKLGELNVAQISPFLQFNLPLGGIGLYVGAAPIIVVNLNTWDFGLFSTRAVYVKGGIETTSGDIMVFAEAMSVLDYTVFKINGIYSAHLGIGLRF